jgi:hypothetical protein
MLVRRTVAQRGRMLGASFGRQTMQDWLEPLAGGVLLAITLLDVFLTVLYARAGTGLLAPRLARGVWRVFRGLAGGRHAGILSYCGPVQLVVLVLMWGALLALGAGLVIHPALGAGVESSSGQTDTDFVTALFVGGSSMSIVGASDYGPTSPGYKLLFLFDSLVGMSVTSLTLTYLMQVYTALRSRNTLGLKVQAQSGEVAAIKETHHFYPVLFYFRFEHAYYAASRILLVANGSRFGNAPVRPWPAATIAIVTGADRGIVRAVAQPWDSALRACS